MYLSLLEAYGSHVQEVYNLPYVIILDLAI